MVKIRNKNIYMTENEKVNIYKEYQSVIIVLICNIYIGQQVAEQYIRKCRKMR